MTEEPACFAYEFKLIEQSYGADHFDFNLASAYMASLRKSDSRAPLQVRAAHIGDVRGIVSRILRRCSG